MDPSNVQTALNLAIDDLKAVFLENRADDKYRTYDKYFVIAPYIKGNIALNTILLPSMLTGKAMDNFTDTVHESLAGIHPEWPKWSVRHRLFFDFNVYLILVFEDVCLEQLFELVGSMYDADEDEGVAVDFVEYYDMVMDSRKRLEESGIIPTPAYTSMFNEYLLKHGHKRRWRNHTRFYSVTP